MANYTYEEVNPTLIENTTMRIRLRDGAPTTYGVKAIEGYVLHDRLRDWSYDDPETYEQIYKLGYTAGETTCPVSYDFASNPREFYAVPADSVPADQIFGGVNNDHEVM